MSFGFYTLFETLVRDIVSYDAATDTTSVQKHLGYNSFGENVEETAPGIVWRMRYTGRFFDIVAQLQDNMYRKYDAAIARWASTDPIGFAAGDANLYRYVGNGPLWQVDPSGMAPPFSGMTILPPVHLFNPQPKEPQGPPPSCLNGYWEKGGRWQVKNMVFNDIQSWGETFADHLPQEEWDSWWWFITEDNIPLKFLDAGWWVRSSITADVKLDGVIRKCNTRFNIDIDIDVEWNVTHKISNRMNISVMQLLPLKFRSLIYFGQILEGLYTAHDVVNKIKEVQGITNRAPELLDKLDVLENIGIEKIDFCKEQTIDIPLKLNLSIKSINSWGTATEPDSWDEPDLDDDSIFIFPPLGTPNDFPVGDTTL